MAGITGTTLGLFEARRQERIARGEAKAAELARQAEAQQRSAAETAVTAEKAAKEQAQRRLKQIEKGVELFAGMLTGINPRNEELGGPTVYEQLLKRAESAADEFPRWVFAAGKRLNGLVTRRKAEQELFNGGD